MAGRPPDPNRKNTNYTIQFPDQDFINRLDNIAKREGINRKTLILRFIEEGFDKHDPGNPQTLLNSFAEGGKQTLNQAVGRVRQKFYNRGFASHLEIVKALIFEGVEDGAKRVHLAKQITQWLKEKSIQVTY